MKKLFFLAFQLFGFLVGTSAIAQITILSGPEQGSYHQFVSDLEKLLNNDSVKLIVNQPTQGATINLENIANPQSPFKVALVQEDYMFIMQNKDILQRTNTMSDIQVIYPFVKEEIHLVTRKEKSINTLKDITDSTLVSIGKNTQGTFITANAIKERAKLNWTSSSVFQEEALPRLLRKQLDAFFVVGSAPMEYLNLNPQALTTELKLVPLEDFDDWAKYYQKDTIYAENYRWLTEDVPTYAVQSYLAVNISKLSESEKAQLDTIIKKIEEGFGELVRTGHPKWKEVNLKDFHNLNWPVYKISGQ